MNTINANDNKHTTAAQEHKGLIIHLIVTLCVSALVTTINFVFCPVFLWFAFPIVGMCIGFVAHYLDVRKLLTAQPAQN